MRHHPTTSAPSLSAAESGSASRRMFLQRSAALSVAASAAPWALTLSAMGEAAAQSNPGDYKALVCVYLYGGNDGWNTLTPYDDASYALYQKLRGNIAYARNALTPTLLTPLQAAADARQFALAPSMASLMPLWAQGRMAMLHNVGTLIQPTTKAQYVARSAPLPPKLFSHNDQQSFWQSSQAEGGTQGWGGRMGDLFASGNGNATFTCINVTGNAVYLSGASAVPYQVTANGAVPVNGIKSALFGSTAASQALRQIMTTPSASWLASAHASVAQRSIGAFDQLDAALRTAPAPTGFPAGNPLASQLAMVARIISARSALGAKRQVFLVSLGGFDTHDSQLSKHPALLGQVADAMSAFYAATVSMGVAHQVTAFTGTDFGRTLVSNNDGSDHGWGAVQWVVGGAVNGGRFVGPAPLPANNGPDDVGQGRLLPALSVQQYAATLAQWFGVSGSNLALVLPQLPNFATRDLGFMAPG